MAKRFTAELSGQSFRRLARDIMRYRREFDRKVKLFCEEVANEGQLVIMNVLAEHIDTGETIGSVKMISKGSNGVYKVSVQVTSDAILFLEFGSGLNFAPPHAAEHGMGPGTFSRAKRQDPEFPNWANPDGWWYYGNDGKSHKSYGMPASMPMYRGGKRMEEVISETAKRVFGNG